MAIQSHANAGQDRPARWTLGRDKLAIRPWQGTDPSILVGICVGLIIIGLIFALNLTEFDSLAAVAAFLKLPIWQRVAWLIVALSSLCLLAGTIWQSHQLAVQANTIDASAKRFHNLYEKVDALSLAHSPCRSPGYWSLLFQCHRPHALSIKVNHIRSPNVLIRAKKLTLIDHLPID